MNIKQMLCTFMLSGLSFFAAQGSMPKVLSDIQNNTQSYVREPAFQEFLRTLPVRLETIDIYELYKRPDTRDGITTYIPESIRVGYVRFKETMIKRHEQAIGMGSHGADPAAFETFNRRCAAIEEVFEKAGKPLEESSSWFGKSNKSSGSNRSSSPIIKRALIKYYSKFAIAGIAVLTIGGIALKLFLDERKSKPKTAA